MELAASDERIYDYMTGTPLYMGIGMLLGSKRRSVVEDLESLFYVILDVVSTRQHIVKGKLDPWEFKDTKSLAATHASPVSVTRNCTWKHLVLKVFLLICITFSTCTRELASSMAASFKGQG